MAAGQNEPQCAERPEEFELLFYNLRLSGRFDDNGPPCDAHLEIVKIWPARRGRSPLGRPNNTT